MKKQKKCNKCGKKFDLWDSRENFTIKRRAGYGTKYDGSFIRLHLCCGCMEKIISECEISPIKERE